MKKPGKMKYTEEDMKKIAVLGSTGSIGTQTLEVVRTNKDIEITP